VPFLYLLVSAEYLRLWDIFLGESHVKTPGAFQATVAFGSNISARDFLLTLFDQYFGIINI